MHWRPTGHAGLEPLQGRHDSLQDQPFRGKAVTGPVKQRRPVAARGVALFEAARARLGHHVLNASRRRAIVSAPAVSVVILSVLGWPCGMLRVPL
jgi:hypothetical protein